MCARCRRPQVVCYCQALPRLDTKTRVVILQHPRERTTAIGTARMASLALANSQLHVGMRWGEHAAFLSAIGNPAAPPILLYPGPGARDILRDPPKGPVTLVVVDGTWSQAKTLVRDNPVLAALPRYAFAAPEVSEYRIRKEPDDAFVSTIEALMHVLGALEGDAEKFRALLTPFRAMVDAQLAHQAAHPRARVRQPRSGPRGPQVPDILRERYDDLVCIVGEANAWPCGAPRSDDERFADGTPDEMLHWVAMRIATGEIFDRIAAPIRDVSPTTPMHIDLPLPTLHAGGSQRAVIDAFSAFVRPTDLLCAWGHFAPNMYRANGGTLPDGIIDLRGVAQRLTPGKLGTLEAYAERMLRAQRAAPASGRAGARVGRLADLLAMWISQPFSDA